MKSILSFIAFLVSVGIYAQSVSGLVTSEDGPLPGATVLVKGTSNGTTTDFDGNFTINAGADDVLVVSFVGFVSQEVSVAGQDNITINLVSDSELEEVIVTGYGSQSQREITSATVNVNAEDFNQGPINDPVQLLQGKVAGLSIYKPGGNPNESPTIRIRGLSTLGANTSPLVVIDGVPGATLASIDPNDIESMTVLKDGSGAAIYGTRGSSGVILITSKKGRSGPMQVSYSTSFAQTSIAQEIPVLSPTEFVANGGTDLGTQTDWVDAITRNGSNVIHNFSVSGGGEKSTYRMSANLRRTEGILNKTGYDQMNTRAALNTKAINDKLDLTFNLSYTKFDRQLGDERAFEFAQFYNPTAPIFANDPNARYQVSPTQFGGYFEQLGLFRSYNPVSIIEQTRNTRISTDFVYNVAATYNLTDKLELTAVVAEQRTSSNDQRYRPTTLWFEGNATSPTRKGLANLASFNFSSKVFEYYGKYNIDLGNSNLNLTGGYSYNQFNTTGNSLELGDFPDNSIDWSDAIGASQDLLNSGYIGANSYASPDDKIIGLFGRANLVINNKYFVNASLRREGSSRFGADNRWGVFPSFGVGADLNEILGLGVRKLKVRASTATTGALPGATGLTAQARTFVYDGGGSAGGSTVLARGANPELKWEEKNEFNFGIEYETERLSLDFDVYNRKIKDFILNQQVDVAVYGVDRRFQNAGQITSSGWEFKAEYDVIKNDNLTYETGLILYNNKVVLDEFSNELGQYGFLGSPGQNAVTMVRVKVGDKLGQIYGPVFDGVNPDGSIIFKDVNNDGTLNTDSGNVLQDNYDGEVLGSGYPTLEMSWSNYLDFGNGWTLNAFFRGAFGHSLINTFRAFYEPNVPSQTSYNQMNTSLREPNLGVAQYSSLYVEKADFFLLDNLTLSKQIFFQEGSGVKDITVSLNALRPFVITNYTGTDPSPELFDSLGGGEEGVEAGSDGAALLAPGIDRREDYFASKTFSIGLTVNF